MSSLTNDFNLDNELSYLLTEAISYVHDRTHLGSPTHQIEKG
jgi:hypothetical protein